MKKILFILTIILLTVTTGCKKDKNPIDYKSLVIGEWHCAPTNIDADIHAVFEEDGSFDLYQRVGEGRYRHYEGTWSSDKSTLSGTYSDGSDWGSSYKMDFDDDNTMILTALNGSEEVMTYLREAVPAEVKDSCIDVKSTDWSDYSPAF